jgi:hypothetical protein
MPFALQNRPSGRIVAVVDEKDKARKQYVTLVNTPGGFFTTVVAAPVKTQTEKDLDKIVDNLLQDVDVPLFSRER